MASRRTQMAGIVLATVLVLCSFAFAMSVDQQRVPEIAKNAEDGVQGGGDENISFAQEGAQMGTGVMATSEFLKDKNIVIELEYDHKDVPEIDLASEAMIEFDESIGDEVDRAKLKEYIQKMASSEVSKLREEHLKHLEHHQAMHATEE